LTGVGALAGGEGGALFGEWVGELLYETAQ
jgi:hypothetical protein